MESSVEKLMYGFFISHLSALISTRFLVYNTGCVRFLKTCVNVVQLCHNLLIWFYFLDIIGVELTHEMERHNDNCYDVRKAVRCWECMFLEASFVHKVRKELEASSVDVSPVEKLKKHSHHLHNIRTSLFVQRMHNIIGATPGTSLTFVRYLQLSQGAQSVVHEDILYKTYVMKNGHFMRFHAQEQILLRENDYWKIWSVQNIAGSILILIFSFFSKEIKSRPGSESETEKWQGVTHECFWCPPY